MRTIVIALILASALLAGPVFAAACDPGGRAVKGAPRSQPVTIMPVQVDAGQVVVRLENRGVTALRGKLMSGPASVGIALAPGARREVRLPAPMAKLAPNAATQPVPLSFRGTIGGARWAWTKTFSVLRPVIPMSEREAPTVEMLFAAAPVYPVGRPGHPAQVQILHDETGLIFRVDVRDSRPVGEGSSVRISLRAWKGAAPTTHEFRYAFGAGGPATVQADGEASAGAVDARRAGANTIYDIRIPWSALFPLTGASGERFRMDVSVAAGKGRPASMAPGPSPTDWLAWTLS